MRIYEAIDAAAHALKSGAHPNIVRMALLSDGIPAVKADVIIGWATQTNKRSTMKTVDEMKSLFPWEEGMGEISGFGGGYEEACRNMLYSGLAYLDSNPNADLKAIEYANIYGFLTPDSKEAMELSDVLDAAEPGCSGAMHSTAMQHCMYIATNGWNKYSSEMKKRG